MRSRFLLHNTPNGAGKRFCKTIYYIGVIAFELINSECRRNFYYGKHRILQIPRLRK